MIIKSLFFKKNLPLIKFIPWLYNRMLYFCCMRYISYIFISFLVLCNSAYAQEKWDLQKIVDYAVANNISAKQLDVQSSISELTLKQSKSSQIPSLSFNGNTSVNGGLNQDPVTFRLVTQTSLTAGLQLQSSAQIFNWFSKKNTILANEWQYEAAKANADKLRNDISLAVANNYLQILLAMEQEDIARVQLKQTQAQLANTRKLVAAGSLPELNAAELESQEALDSANYIGAKGTVEQSILQLKANMNMDAATPFAVAVPPVELIPIEKIADLQPEDVYALAVKNLPQQRANEFNLKAAEKISAAEKGRMYPTISAFGNLSSNYFNSTTPQFEPTGTYVPSPLGSQVTIGNNDYPVTNPGTKFVGYQNLSAPFFNQVHNNFSQVIGLSLSVPIFNGFQLHTNYEKSKLNIKNAQLQQDLDNQKIKQDIYQAYNSATVALEKFNAGQKSVAAAQRTLDFAQKRYAVGMLSTFELITQQNNLFRAKLNDVLNQYDFVFKMKVLEFYKGQGIKL
jgi:outer membrane protein